MNVSFGYSILYLVSAVLLLGGAFLYRKSEDRLYAATWIPLLLVCFTCYEAVLAALLQWVTLPVNIVSVGLLNLVPAVWLWYQILRKRNLQQYIFAWYDAGIWLVFLAFAVWFAGRRFGGAELAINYATIDPAMHFQSALDVMMNQKVENMFHAALNNALVIETFAPFTTADRYYRIYILADILNYLVAGGMFYGAVRRFLTKRFAKCTGVVLSMVYFLGYPLCTLMFGFGYLGMGISIVAAILVLADGFMRDELWKWCSIVLLMIACAGVFTCYMLFMPVVFFSVILCIFRKQWKRRKLVSPDTVVTCLAVFLLPCIIGLYYCYGGVFSGGVTVDSAINNEGACYRDLFSNFLFCTPLALFGYAQTVRGRRNETIVYLFPFTLMFVAALFVKGMQNEVSSYYYYKNYHLMWFLVFYLAVSALAYLESQTKVLAGCCLAVWAAVFALNVTDAEEKIQSRNVLFCEVPKAGMLNDIFSFNFDTLALAEDNQYPESKLKLYAYVYWNLLQNGTVEAVPFVGSWEDELWYQDISWQRDTGWQENLKDAEYIVILKDENSADYLEYQVFFDTLEAVYENDAGCVARIQQ
jgi:hypothetical protein